MKCYMKVGQNWWEKGVNFQRESSGIVSDFFKIMSSQRWVLKPFMNLWLTILENLG